MASTERLPRRLNYDLVLVVCVLCVFFAQTLFTLAFIHRLPLEDVAESVRSPYWLAHRTVYNGVSTSVAYYAMLAGAYKLFGFSLYLCKWWRLGTQLLSLSALALLLRRWLGPARAVVPLLAAGLSPSWLYFNTNQVEYGIDLQCAPFLAALAWYAPLGSPRARAATYFMCGLIGSWCALLYPTVIFYLPPFALVLFWRDRAARAGAAGAAVLGFLLPPAAFLLYVKQPLLLINDPEFKAGMYRGGGGGLSLDPSVVASNLRVVLGDLFTSERSYSFDIPRAEFSGWFGALGFSAVVLGVAVVFFCRPKNRLFFWILGATAFLFAAPLLAHLAPGLRRCTGGLFGFYFLVAYLWREAGLCERRWHKLALRASAAFVLASNVSSAVINLRSDSLVDYSKNLSWFRTEANPEESLAFFELAVRNGSPLRCEKFDFHSCRYAEIFSAIEGATFWSGEPSPKVIAWDPAHGRYRTILMPLWEENIWPQ